MKLLPALAGLMLALAPLASACGRETEQAEPLSTRVAELEAQIGELERELTSQAKDFQSASDAPMPSDPKLAVLKEWTGNGSRTKRTEPFSVEKLPWAISWSLASGLFGGVLKVSVYRPESADPVEMAVSTALEGEDSTFVYETGTFYLHIQALGKWSVRVETIH